MNMPRFSRRSARRHGVVVAVALALLGSLLPARAQTGVESLTIGGPAKNLLGVATAYTGQFSVGGLGIPAQEIRIEIDDAHAATSTTEIDGSYSANLTFESYGFHTVVAIARHATPLEVRSETLTVETTPELDETIATDIYSSNTFLYTGPNAVQTGMAPGTIKPERAAVVRGAVTDVAGQPVEGVRVTLPGHPELGETSTTDEGTLDLAVNGGQLLTVRYEKPGFITVEREIPVDWRDYEVLPEVAMVPFDAAVTTVEAGAADMQVARGSSVTDNDGQRQATLLFPAGTTATMTLPNGSTQSLSTLSVRATEFTVGSSGPRKMPADLPATSGYTYAVELSADEATQAGATKVSFSNGVPFYVENFLDFPVGTDVPTGYYDREKHSWLASDDGRVVKILSITAGKADLDVDGDGVADSGSALTSLGITDEERANLASLYTAGQTLWRVPITHFTPWDCNWPYGLPDGAGSPNQKRARRAISPGQCETAGSIIGCENQTLGEQIPVAGTPFSLRYDSARVPGGKATNSLRIPLSETLPPGLKRIELEVKVAGRLFSYTFDPPTANLSYTFVWDGKDAYGRFAQGSQRANVRIAYVYEAVYRAPGTFAQSFAQAGGAPLVGNRARQEITVFQEYEQKIGGLYDSGLQALGGWTLSSHHSYDPDGGVLHMGSGETRMAEAIFPAIAGFAGTGAAGPSGEGTNTGDGGPATQAGLGRVRGLTVGPDGSVYIADSNNGVVRRVNPDGVITRFAGGGTPPSGNGDGGPATSAELGSPTDVALGSDGSVFILDEADGRVRRVSSSGTISTYAGGGSPSDGLGDGGPATSAAFSSPQGIAVGKAGTVYVSDIGHDRVRLITADGTINSVAGGGSPADGLGDGLIARQAKLLNPYDVELAGDGSVLIADTGNNRIRRVRPDGVIETIAGNGGVGASGDGGLATQATVGLPTGISVDSVSGSVFIAQSLNNRVRKVAADKTITTVVGVGSAGSSGDEGPPARAQLNDPQAVAVGADERLYVADTGNFRVRRVLQSVQGFATSDFMVPSPDGSEIFHFNASGRHLRTLEALTGAVLWTFSYDSEDRLVSITDDFTNVTTIERNTSGVPTAIVSPFGLRTSLTLGTNGYLSSVTNAADETVLLSHDEDGLLTSLTTPRNFVHSFTYDDLGRLIEDEAPDGFTTTLTSADTPTGFVVTTTSTEGRSTVYRTEQLASGEQRRSVTQPTEARADSTTFADGRVTLVSPDGTITSSTFGPDPRWGLQVPIPISTTVLTPGGKSLTTTSQRTSTLSDTANPLSLTSQTDSVTTNGKTTSRTFNKAALTVTATTPTGRQGVTSLSDKAQIVQVQDGDLAAISFGHDARGRLLSITRGSGVDERITTIDYDPSGFVEKITNPLDEGTTFERDEVGRALSLVLPDTEAIGSSYDATGNLLSVTPPDKPLHDFDYTESGFNSKYTPPSFASEVDPSTSYDYNLDRQPLTVALPDGRSLSFEYQSGRLSSVSWSRGERLYSYDSSFMLSRIDSPGTEVLRYAYDGSLLKAITSEGSIGGAITYGYDSDLRIGSRVINDGVPITYAYNNDGQLTSAGSLGLTFDSTNGYLSSTSVGSGTPLTTSHGYNSFGETTEHAASRGSSQLYAVSFERDKLGRIRLKSETIDGETSVYEYSYDSRGRLTDLKTDGLLTHHYVYDANGNRIDGSDPSGSVSGTYDVQDRLLTYGGNSYTYRESGELKTKTNSQGSTSYDYDELGNLAKVTLPSGTVIDYVWDGVGRRIAKKVNGITTQKFLYGSGRPPIGELDEQGNLVSTFVYGSRSHVPDLVTKSGVTYRIISDQLGSPRLVINVSDGSVAQRIDYDAFGNETLDTNPGFQPFGFAGGLSDLDTGILRFGGRDYDPEVGRWTAKDPIGFQGGTTNLYTYTNNDPVNSIDPTGLRQQAGGEAAGSPTTSGKKASEYVGGGESMFSCVGLGYWDRVQACLDEYSMLLEVYQNWMGIHVYPEFHVGIKYEDLGEEYPPYQWLGPIILWGAKGKDAKTGTEIGKEFLKFLGFGGLGAYGTVASSLGHAVPQAAAGTIVAGIGGLAGQSMYCQAVAAVGDTY